MVNGRVPKDVMYGERVSGTHTPSADHLAVTKTPASVT